MATVDQRIPKLQTAETEGRVDKSATVCSSSDVWKPRRGKRSSQIRRSALTREAEPSRAAHVPAHTAGLLQRPAMGSGVTLFGFSLDLLLQPPPPPPTLPPEKTQSNASRSRITLEGATK